MDIEDASMDWVMQISQKIIQPAREKNIPPFVLLNIDNKTHQAWGEPIFTPRNRLKNLIDTAVQAQARLIVVDVNLKTPIEGLEGFTQKLHPYDQALYDYMENYSTYCQEKHNCPPIILAQAPKTPIDKPIPKTSIWEKLVHTFWNSPITIPEPRIGFLETAVAQSKPNIQWTSTLFLYSYDHVIRRWWLWQPTCTAEKPGIIPSIQLLTAAMIRNNTTPQQTQEDIDKALAPFKKDCNSDTYIPSPLIKPVSIGKNLTVSTGMHGIRQRIMYSMPWLPPKYEDTKIVRYHLFDQAGEIFLTVFSARFFAEFSQPTNLEALKNKIVVIGTSYDRNVHQTPLNNMPGALIVINAIHSLLQYEEIDTLSFWDKIWLTASFIFVMSLLFAFVESIWATLISGLLVILIIVPISLMWWLESGIWLDFALPLLAIQYHQTVSDINQMKANMKWIFLFSYVALLSSIVPKFHLGTHCQEALLR